MSPLAIVGVSCRLPGGANDAEKLWSILKEGVDTVSKFYEYRRLLLFSSQLIPRSNILFSLSCILPTNTIYRYTFLIGKTNNSWLSSGPRFQKTDSMRAHSTTPVQMISMAVPTIRVGTLSMQICKPSIPPFFGYHLLWQRPWIHSSVCFWR